MPTPSLDVLGVVVRHPASVATNLVLTLECGVIFLLLRPRSISLFPSMRGAHDAPGSPWAGFFLFMAVSSFLGAAKHGFPHYLGPLSLGFVLTGSALASGMAILHAEVATIIARVPGGRAGQLLLTAVFGRFLLFAGALAATRSFITVVVNAGMGLVPLLLTETFFFLRGDRAGGWIVSGFTVGCLTGAVYLSGFSPSPWFNHVDLAHMVLMAVLLLLWRGARDLGLRGGRVSERAGRVRLKSLLPRSEGTS